MQFVVGTETAMDLRTRGFQNGGAAPLGEDWGGRFCRSKPLDCVVALVNGRDLSERAKVIYPTAINAGPVRPAEMSRHFKRRRTPAPDPLLRAIAVLEREIGLRRLLCSHFLSVGCSPT